MVNIIFHLPVTLRKLMQFTIYDELRDCHSGKV